MSDENTIKIKQLDEEKELPFICQNTCASEKGCTCQNKLNK